MFELDMTSIFKKYFPDKTIFNLGIEYDSNGEFLICARCFDGNIRKWSGTNSIILLRIKLSSENFIMQKTPEILSIWYMSNKLEIINIIV
jgi:hypothetical protein